MGLLERVCTERDQARKDVRTLRVALDLILPLAKGYVSQNNVGNNREFIVDAETALAETGGER